MLEAILGRLDGVKPTRRGYIARCPAHADTRPSLSIAQGDDGRILLYCFKGCNLKDICEALSIKPADLFPDTGRMNPEAKRQYQEFKKHIKTEHSFEELRRRAFIAMCEFRDLTLQLYEHYKLDTPADVLKAVHMLPAIEWYIETLIGKTNEAQIELLREGVITRWSRLHNSRN